MFTRSASQTPRRGVPRNLLPTQTSRSFRRGRLLRKNRIRLASLIPFQAFRTRSPPRPRGRPFETCTFLAAAATTTRPGPTKMTGILAAPMRWHYRHPTPTKGKITTWLKILPRSLRQVKPCRRKSGRRAKGCVKEIARSEPTSRRTHRPADRIYEEGSNMSIKQDRMAADTR